MQITVLIPLKNLLCSFAQFKFSVLHADNTVVLCICRTIYLYFTLQNPTPTRHSPFCRKRPEAQLTGYWHSPPHSPSRILEFSLYLRMVYNALLHVKAVHFNSPIFTILMIIHKQLALW